MQQNWRGQPLQMSLGSVWTLGNDYGTATNNGNVTKQTLGARRAGERDVDAGDVDAEDVPVRRGEPAEEADVAVGGGVHLGRRRTAGEDDVGVAEDLLCVRRDGAVGGGVRGAGTGSGRGYVTADHLGAAIRLATYSGRPYGSGDFVRALERELGRRLERRKGGRPRKEAVGAAQKWHYRGQVNGETSRPSPVLFGGGSGGGGSRLCGLRCRCLRRRWPWLGRRAGSSSRLGRSGRPRGSR